ncbi:DNA mismatch repair protein MSH7-like [Spinacia oleracea]|uniref:DNA mismatch repair protein MSH7-like n=2 Tax=Spinacia oleracea TaxID=3562 RepID=A0ABM3REL0_SPIOL|nr:DNA mismatch repair protein MSH7-like [Spinacia oleracea]
MNLLILLHNDEHLMSLLSKVLDIPQLSEHNALSEFLSQFEAAIDSDFPKYQDHDATEADAETLSILIELFVEKASQWSQVIFALCCIDVLRSFSAIAIDSSGSMCRPSILPQSTSNTVCQNSKGPILNIKGLWHPFALRENGVPVPNDMILGEGTNGHHPRTLLLTGPNMGGKSTLLRAACLAVILAQLGCYVPSEMCVLSVADTIFTRLGATDRIMTGESKFHNSLFH